MRFVLLRSDARLTRRALLTHSRIRLAAASSRGAWSLLSGCPPTAG